MEDAENNLPPSKKRSAGRELTRDTPLDDEEDTPELETGTFKRASDEVLATRRIVKVRRQQTSSAPSSNPFSGIHLVAPTESSVNPVEATAQAQSASESTTADDTKGNDSIIKDSDKAKDGDNTQSEIKIDEIEDKSAAKAAVESSEKEYTVEKESASGKPEVNKEQSVDGNNNETDDKYVSEKESASDKPEVDKEQSVDGNNNENDHKHVAEETANDKPEVDKEQNKDGSNNEDEDNDVGDKESAREVDKEKTEHDEDKKDNADNEDKESKVENEEPSAEGGPFKSFQQLSSSQNAFAGLAGTGFSSSSSFSFGSISNDGSAGSGSGSIFATKNGNPFSLGLSNNGSSVFGVSGSSGASKSEGSSFSTMQEVVVETGEENEKAVFNADSVLFEFADGSWKERGKGEVKVNITITGTEKARLLMRSRGNYRLILNAHLYPDMKLTNMDKRGVTFACVNSATEGKDGLSTFALKFKDGSIVEEFKAAIMAHKGEASRGLKTPENSP